MYANELACDPLFHDRNDSSNVPPTSTKHTITLSCMTIKAHIYLNKKTPHTIRLLFDDYINAPTGDSLWFQPRYKPNVGYKACINKMTENRLILYF